MFFLKIYQHFLVQVSNNENVKILRNILRCSQDSFRLLLILQNHSNVRCYLKEFSLSTIQETKMQLLKGRSRILVLLFTLFVVSLKNLPLLC